MNDILGFSYEEEEMEKIKVIGRIAMVIFVIAAAAVMAGCGTTVNVKPEESMSGKEIPKLSFASITIEVKTEVEDSQDAVKMFNESLVNEFKERNITVVDNGADAKMVVTIKHLKKVSLTKRFFLGILAGTAELKANIVVVVLKNNPIIFSVDISSWDASGIAGHTGAIINDAAEEIANKII